MMITENPRQMHLSWDEAVTEAQHALSAEEWISDAAAQTIAAAYMSPAARSWNMTALAHGRPFDTDALREEIDREARLAERLGPNLRDDEVAALSALRDWLNGVEQR